MAHDGLRNTSRPRGIAATTELTCTSRVVSASQKDRKLFQASHTRLNLLRIYGIGRRHFFVERMKRAFVIPIRARLWNNAFPSRSDAAQDVGSYLSKNSSIVLRRIKAFERLRPDVVDRVHSDLSLFPDSRISDTVLARIQQVFFELR